MHTPNSGFLFAVLASGCIGPVGFDVASAHHLDAYFGHLSRREDSARRSGREPNIDASDPDFAFPERIGLARIAFGKPTEMPGTESEIWSTLDEATRKPGRFVALDLPVGKSFRDSFLKRWSSPPGEIRALQPVEPSRHMIAEIQSVALRQRCDAVLIYEIDAEARSLRTPLALVDWTVLAAMFLPSRQVTVRGIVRAVLLDTRADLLYGAWTAEATRSGRSSPWDEFDVVNALTDEIGSAAVNVLVAKFECALAMRLAATMPAPAPNAASPQSVVTRRATIS